MHDKNFRHIIRAAAALANRYEIVVLGKCSILGLVGEIAVDTESLEALAGDECDLFIPDEPVLTDMLGHGLGASSQFHKAFGYCIRAVNPKDYSFASGWRDRLCPVSPGPGLALGYCLHPNDLAVAGLVSGQDGDVAFVRELLGLQMIDANWISDSLDRLETPVDPVLIDVARARWAALAGGDRQPAPSPFD